MALVPPVLVRNFSIQAAGIKGCDSTIWLSRTKKPIDAGFSFSTWTCNLASFIGSRFTIRCAWGEFALGTRLWLWWKMRCPLTTACSFIVSSNIWYRYSGKEPSAAILKLPILDARKPTGRLVFNQGSHQAFTAWNQMTPSWVVPCMIIVVPWIGKWSIVMPKIPAKATTKICTNQVKQRCHYQVLDILGK